MVMNRQLCKYSIIRFQPFVETEEFANIGIVLYLPEKNELHFELLSGGEYKRMTDFFAPLNREIYVAAIQIIRAELEQIQLLLRNSSHIKINMYDELICPREGVIQYSQNRVLLSTNVVQTLTDLFEHYVNRKFAHKENYEEVMKKIIHALLKKYGLEKQFKSGFLGDDDKYKVNLPFINKLHQSAIKPIHFKHSEPNALIEHGLTWLMKIKQLKRHGFIQPENILFTYHTPDEKSGILFDAFNDVKMQIEEVGILMADINESETVSQFVHRYPH